MKKHKQPDGMPVWFDGKSINEALFCDEFLQTHKIIFTNGAFFTPEGRVTDELPLRGEIFEKLKCCAFSNIPRKISNIVELMKLAALVEDFPPEPDRIHLSNGTLFLDGRFVEGKPEIVRNRFPVAYNPNAPKPVLWLQFLDDLLYPEDIPTLQEYIGYCLIPSNKGQRMMVIKGNGGEGKSQIGAVLGVLFGSNMKDGSIGKISENRFARADLEHILLCVDDDIIDRATWEKVQTLTKGTRRKRPKVTQEPSVFSGYLKCPECGGNLNFHFNQGNHDIKFFSCQNHNSGLRKCSSTHYIRLDFLERVVLYEVNRLAAFASEYEDAFIKAIMGSSAKVAENARVRKQRELDGLVARDKELDVLFERLYEDNVAGKIDDARFAKMAKRYEQEQGENSKLIKALRLELKQSEGKRMDMDDFLVTVRQYTNATKITKRMVGELIDHIDVYHAEKQDSVTTQRVVIHYNCIGAFDVPDRRKIPEADIIMETRKGVAVSYAPAV